MVRLETRSAPDDLFARFSDTEKREMGQWDLKLLELEQKRRQRPEQYSDEQLREQLAEIAPSQEPPGNASDFLERVRQLSDAELERLIEIRQLYRTSSPYASSRIDIYKDIAALAPWDESCLLKIVDEYEQSDEPLKACQWLARAALVNPDNEQTRQRLNELTASTAGLRRRKAILRVVSWTAAVVVLLAVIWGTGYRISWDDTKVLEAVAAMQETKLPAEVKPDHVIRHVFTGYQRVQFSNPQGYSYVVLVSSPFRKLQHLPFPSRETPAEPPSETSTYDFTIRGHEAEFVYRKYNHYESVQGYFQGKQHPVALRARFEYADRDPYSEPGGAPAWIKTFEPDAIE